MINGQACLYINGGTMMKRSGKKVWYSHRGTVIVFIILRALVVLTGVLSALRGDYESVLSR